MAREKTWLSKLRSQISHKLINPTAIIRPNGNKSSTHVGVLAFEMAALLTKLLALHHSLSDKAVVRLKNDVVSLEGVRKIVSNDDSFLLSLACAEMIHTVHVAAKSAARFAARCSDPALRSFYEALEDFAETGRDPHGWASPCPRDLDGLARRADRYIAATSALYRELEELASLESGLTKAKRKKSPVREESINNGASNGVELQQKIVWQKQEVKSVKDKSLWNRSFDSAVLLLARLAFTVLSRIKLVFGLGPPATLPRSLSASAAVFPASADMGPGPGPDPNATPFVSGPLRKQPLSVVAAPRRGGNSGVPFFERKARALAPPPSTLGAAALALHYANLIIVLEKMIKAPHLVGLDAREDVYSMLPSSIRSSLRSRLKGRVGFSAADPALAGEWRDALGRILAWLAPLAHNMIKWHNERSFEQQNLTPKLNTVLLLQTLHFANREKTEAAITELLVGLNYIWRFEREMNARALLECSNFFFNRNNSKNNSLQLL